MNSPGIPDGRSARTRVAVAAAVTAACAVLAMVVLALPGGPITRAGCKAICPTHNSPCEGCRGLIKKAETDCVKEVLERYKLSYEDIRRRCTMYNYGREECSVDE